MTHMVSGVSEKTGGKWRFGDLLILDFWPPQPEGISVVCGALL